MVIYKGALAKAKDLLLSPVVRDILVKVPMLRRRFSKTHPFDAEHGTDTGGFVPVEALVPGADLARAHPYAGSQPSIVRRALRMISDHDRYVFVDVGCGKGRPLLIASEFRFRRIIGIEISSSLARIAERNAKLVHESHPERTPIEVVCADVDASDIGHSHLMLFLYHSLPRAVLCRFVDRLVGQLGKTIEHVVMIYYNPVFGDVLDSSLHFVRVAAETFDYDKQEIGYGPDERDSIVIWQSTPTRFASSMGADRRILVTDPLWRAELDWPTAHTNAC